MLIAPIQVFGAAVFFDVFAFDDAEHTALTGAWSAALLFDLPYPIVAWF
jgi:hypothetical protein